MDKVCIIQSEGSLYNHSVTTTRAMEQCLCFCFEGPSKHNSGNILYLLDSNHTWKDQNLQCDNPSFYIFSLLPSEYWIKLMPWKLTVSCICTIEYLAIMFSSFIQSCISFSCSVSQPCDWLRAYWLWQRLRWDHWNSLGPARHSEMWVKCEEKALRSTHAVFEMKR